MTPVVPATRSTNVCIDAWQWNVEGEEVHSQKIRVAYLPPEGQTVPEEDESHANMSSLLGVPGQDVSSSMYCRTFISIHDPETSTVFA